MGLWNTGINNMLLSIIIVSYNTAQLTLETLNSVKVSLSKSPQLQKQAEIIVIDNNSSDKSVSTLSALASQSLIPIHLLKNRANLGFAKANNQGIAKAKGQYLLLLNSDTLVEDRALERLVSTFEKAGTDPGTATLASHAGELDHLGILAATLLNPDKTLQAQGGSFPTLWSLGIHMLMLDDLPILGKWLPSTQHTGLNQRQVQAPNQLQQQDWVGATAVLVKKAVFDEVGLLDEDIFMYGEDVEFCMRAKFHHWDIAVHPQALVTHYGSASSSSERAIQGELQGYLYIWSKHKPFWQLQVAKTLMRLGCLLRMIIFGTIFGNATKATIYSRALETL